jgi:hypothetical protein
MDGMSDDYSDEVYGDTDPNNLPQDAAGQGAIAGDGLPGVPVDGYPGVRAGAFGSGNGLLGLIKVSNPAPVGGEASMPAAYTPDGHGGVQLKPGFAASHPKGPFDWGGMAKEIDWPGVALDLGSIAAGSLPLVGGKAADVLKAMPGMGVDAWRELHHDARRRKDGGET